MKKIPICIECGQQYHRDSGPMICVCWSCLKKPPQPDKYIKQGNLYISNKNENS